MEINNMKKLDLGKLISEKAGGDWILKTKLNVNKGMEEIMVLKPEEIKEIIKKTEEFYKEWEGALDGKIENFIYEPAHAGGGRGTPIHVGGSKGTTAQAMHAGGGKGPIVNPATIENPWNKLKKQVLSLLKQVLSLFKKS